VDQEQKPRERSSISELVPDWSPTREQKLWAARIIIVLVVVLGILTLISQIFGITVLQWLKVLAVPITVGAAVPLLNWLQKKRELDIEHQRGQDDALQAYLDQMGQLLLQRDGSGKLLIAKRGIGEFEGDFISALVRSRTLTILAMLDSDRPISRRKGSVLQFLYESGLINKAPETVVKLQGDAKTGGPLPTTPGQSAADLSRADLRRATLSRADLSGTRLSYAFLSDAKLDNTDLTDINLYHTDLSRADLGSANLRKADLRGADLSGASLYGANLSDANVTQDQLDQAKTLDGAIMPDGQKYEEWLKGKRSGEDGENSGPS
jgi:hypothetical protein